MYFLLYRVQPMPHFILFCIGNELVKDKFALLINACFIGHHIFQTNALLRATLLFLSGILTIFL